ncbi:MAG: helix-turn-helix domain-containing protein [Aristaeellaceae bacterium]
MIRIDLDVMLARRKMSLTELSQRVGITLANLSILKTGKAKAIRFQTLDAICRALDCQPGDILVYEPGEPDPD